MDSLRANNGFPTRSSRQRGVAYSQALGYSPEWRRCGSDDKSAGDPTRCGDPINPSLAESSLGCEALRQPSSSFEAKKIGRWASWRSTPRREKPLRSELQLVANAAQSSGAPKVFVDHAIATRKGVSEQKTLRGLSRDGIKAASTYASRRLSERPRAAREVAETLQKKRPLQRSRESETRKRPRAWSSSVSS